MKTKVWLVIWGLKDGGAEVLAREYARLVDKGTFEATLVTMYPFENTANFRRAMDAQLPVISIFKKRNTLSRAVRALAGKWYVPWILGKMLKKNRPDVIHFNSQMALYFSPLREQLSGIRLLYTCHSEINKHFFPQEEDAVHHLIRDYNLRLIALHDDMKRELDQRFHRDNTVVIRNGIDISRFQAPVSNPSATRQSIGISADAYVVGHIGRFSKVKNHTFLLQIFQKIIEKKRNAHLLLVGNGELKEAILQEITRLHLEDRVTILSHRTDIPELLHAMDVMVFPSLYEGLSVTLVEAQASGLRCIISDSINPANILSENTVAVSLDKDSEAWANIVLGDAIRSIKYGDIEDYDMNREIRRLEQLYQGKLEV